MFDMDKARTAKRTQLQGEGVAVLKVLQPHIDALPYNNVLDDDGGVSGLGTKYLSMFIVANRLAAGHRLRAALQCAEDFFGIHWQTVGKMFDKFQDSEQAFAADLRGKHAKTLSLLSDPKVKLNLTEFCRTHSKMKGSERLSPAMLALEIRRQVGARVIAAARSNSPDTNTVASSSTALQVSQQIPVTQQSHATLPQQPETHTTAEVPACHKCAKCAKTFGYAGNRDKHEKNCTGPKIKKKRGPKPNAAAKPPKAKVETKELAAVVKRRQLLKKQGMHTSKIVIADVPKLSKKMFSGTQYEAEQEADEEEEENEEKEEDEEKEDDDTLGPPISIKTALRYLKTLGFTKQTAKKGAFYDGYNREDVVADRMSYLREKLEQDKTSIHRWPTPEEIEAFMKLPPDKRPFVELVHDESTCNANDDVKWQYVEEGTSGLLRSKAQGTGVMLSVFINEPQGGPLYDGKNIAAESLEYGKGNYWNSIRMNKQLRKVIAMRLTVFAWARVIWRFDHSSNHTAMADDALNASKMNVTPGGKQPKMRATVVLDEASPLYGQRQAMVFETGPLKGQAKGLKQVLGHAKNWTGKNAWRRGSLETRTS